MDYIRIGALSPPTENRSKWARNLLALALQSGVAPRIVPLHEIQAFTANVPPHIGNRLREIAAERGISPAQVSAGLIAEFQAMSEGVYGAGPAPAAASLDAEMDHHLARVRKELQGLTKEIREALPAGRIIFAEAATGSGKGTMACCIAMDAVMAGQQVVISAPIPTIAQLHGDLIQFPNVSTVTIRIILGRANFVCPEVLLDWAEENESPAIQEWINSGGQPLSTAALAISNTIGTPLCWLLEDALSLDERLEPGDVTLSAESFTASPCPAEALYQRIKTEAAGAQIIFCSHHQLAQHTRQQVMKIGADSAFPEKIDVLLVDEAHLLENAFAMIFSQSLHLVGFERHLKETAVTGKTKLIEALGDLKAVVRTHSLDNKRSMAKPFMAADDEHFRAACTRIATALDGVKAKKSDILGSRLVGRLKSVLKSLQNDHHTVRPELTPVREYPVIHCGQANLKYPLGCLWNKTGAAVLISATLYADEVNAGLMRWKLEVPKERETALKPVMPAWVTSPVTFHNSVIPLKPSDCPEWYDALADKIAEDAGKAVGGTLVLATSFATIEAVESRLRPILGDRLIAQSDRKAAAACAAEFRSHSGRPVWLGVGAAWTGIDLSNKAVPADEDFLLTDLIICRLPYNVNRNLTHDRRVAMLGMNIIAQEALWHFRQGIGRLIRRPGVRNRNLYVYDCRLLNKDIFSSKFRRLLSRYQPR